jgi:Surface lipoprotein assembly modifier
VKPLLSGLLLSFALAVNLGVPARSMAEATPRALTSQQARVAAWKALGLGKPGLARQIAQALAQRDPKDIEIHILLSEAERALGRPDQAANHARTGFALASTNRQRFDTANLVARALFAKGAGVRAQFWLRRAANYAPDARAKQMVIRDFRFIADSKPTTTRLSFGAFPTSNINGGTNSDEVPDYLGLTGRPTRPHSGVGVSATLDVRYRLPPAPRRELTFGVRTFGVTYMLSPQAKALNSGKTGTDFSFAGVEISAELLLRPKNPTSGGFGTRTFDLALGQNWYGGDPLSTYQRLTFEQQVRLSDRLQAGFELLSERQQRLDDAKQSATVLGASTRLTRRLDSGDSIRYRLGARQTLSDSDAVANFTTTAGVDYFWNRPDSRVRTSLSLDYRDTRYAGLVPLFNTRRHGRRTSLFLSMFFTQMDYFGFAPTLTLGLIRNQSSISIYDTTEGRVSFGFNSTF